MYIPPERREAEIKRLSQHGVVDLTAVREAVSAMKLVSLRVEAVARIVANMQEQFARVEQYEWQMSHYRIDTKTYSSDRSYLEEVAVTVDLLAEKKKGDEDRLVCVTRGGHYDDGLDTITRRVEFPIRYLTSDDWVETAAEQARRKQLGRLVAARDARFKAVLDARKVLEDCEANLATLERDIAIIDI